LHFSSKKERTKKKIVRGPEPKTKKERNNNNDKQ